MEIGVTERGDAALDLSWRSWVEKGKPAILITKNPAKLLEEFNVNAFQAHNFNIIVHATITGLGKLFEPNVPDTAESLKAYHGLIAFFSSERVVLRVDPVIPTGEWLEKAKSVIKEKDPKGRVRVSFIDQYPHVKQRFKEVGFELPWESFHAPLELRQKTWEELGRPEICGEPGFTCTGCVSEIDCKTLNVNPLIVYKDQRPFCACLANKKELLKEKSQCFHNCLYCYWRT